MDPNLQHHVGITVPQHRRPINMNSSPPPFQPYNPNAKLQFMSFDLGSSSSSSKISTTYGVGVPGSSFEEELPLLEELGINTHLIMRKTLSILNPLRVNTELHEDADLSGPFVLCMVMGMFQLLAGKVQFGVIVGWICLASLFLYVVFNMMGGRDGNLDLYRCLSLVGYCMLPMVIFSALSVFIPHKGVTTLVMAGLTVLWCTRTCTNLLMVLSPHAQQQRILVAYACSLIYLLFSLLIIF